MRLPDDLRHLPRSRRDGDGPLFLAQLCAAAFWGYLAVVAVLSIA